MRRDSTAQFRELENKYVLQQVWTATLRTLHERQDNYQTQTDHLLTGVESEMQKIHRDLSGLEARIAANHADAMQEIAETENKRVVALDKVAEQRHSDRMQQVGWLLTALVLPVIYAVLSGTWHT